MGRKKKELTEAQVEATRKNLDPVKTKEEAKRRGRNGGIKSGQVRRERADLAKTVNRMLTMNAVGETKETLKSLGLQESEQTNIAALIAQLYMMAMNGNLKAAEMLMAYGGFDPEEERKDNEDKRKTAESEARVAAIKKNLGMDISITSGEGEGDVVIYMPKIEEIKEEE